MERSDCRHGDGRPPGTRAGGQRSYPDTAGEISCLALSFGFLLEKGLFFSDPLKGDKEEEEYKGLAVI